MKTIEMPAVVLEQLIEYCQKSECRQCHGKLGDVLPDGTVIPCRHCCGKKK